MVEIEIARPDFVLIGSRYKDEAILLASRELFHVELKEEWESLYQFSSSYPVRKDLCKVNLIAEMRNYVTASGDSYPQAWQELHKLSGMDGWSLWNDGWGGLK